MGETCVFLSVPEIKPPTVKIVYEPVYIYVNKPVPVPVKIEKQPPHWLDEKPYPPMDPKKKLSPHWLNEKSYPPMDKKKKPFDKVWPMKPEKSFDDMLMKEHKPPKEKFYPKPPSKGYGYGEVHSPSMDLDYTSYIESDWYDFDKNFALHDACFHSMFWNPEHILRMNPHLRKLGLEHFAFQMYLDFKRHFHCWF